MQSRLLRAFALVALLAWTVSASSLCDPNRGCDAPTPVGCVPIPECPINVYTPPTIIENEFGYIDGPRPVLHVPPAPQAPPRGVVFVPSAPVPMGPPVPPAKKFKRPPPPPPLKVKRPPIIVLPDEGIGYRQEPVVVVPPTLSSAVLGPEVVSVPAIVEPAPYMEPMPMVGYDMPEPRVVQIAPVIAEEPEVVVRQTPMMVEEMPQPVIAVAPTLVQTLPDQAAMVPEMPVIPPEPVPIILQPEPVIVEEPVLLRTPPPPPLPCLIEPKTICDLNPLTVNLPEMTQAGLPSMTQLVCTGSDFQWALLPVEGGNMMSHRIEIYPLDAKCFDWVELNYLVNPSWPEDLNTRTNKPMWDGTLRMRDLRSAQEMLPVDGGRVPSFDLAVPSRLKPGDNLWAQFNICTVDGCFAESQLYVITV